MPIFSDYDLWKLNPPWVWDDDEPEEDPFMDWAEYEAERQFDVWVSMQEDAEPYVLADPVVQSQGNRDGR